MNGKKPRGRPRQIRAERTKTDLTEISEETEIEDSEDGDRWRGVVKAAEVHNGEKKLEKKINII